MANTFAEHVAELYRGRNRERHPVLQAMFEIRDVVNGDVVVPLPEMDEAEKPMTANLIGEGIDQTGMRVASTMPNLVVPALDPRQEKGRRSIEWADKRRRAISGWWKHSNLRRQHRLKARHLVGYGATVIEIRPDFQNRVPVWKIHDPLTAFPSPRATNDFGGVEDCILAFRKPYGWIKARYPEQAARIYKGAYWDDLDEDPTIMFTILKYADADTCAMVLVGAEKEDLTLDEHVFSGAEMLERYDNEAGVTPFVVTNRLTIDRIQGQFNQTLGLYMAQSKLAALDLIATSKAVFPDMAIVGQDGRAPQLLGDKWQSGLTGEINEVMNGDVQVLQLQPGYKTGEALDRLERSMRLYGVAPQFGGENPVNIRTGRAAEVAMSAQVDFRIQEYQEIMADSLRQEDVIAIETMKGWFGDDKKSFVVGAETNDYVPNQHLESSMHEVVYPMPGADVNGLLLGINNRVAIGTMSQATARLLDPMIENPEVEGDRVVSERLDAALLDSMSQMAAQGALPPADLAGIQRKVFVQNMSLAAAVEAQQQEAQERQAAEVAAQAAEAQPGIAQPGAGAESSVIPEPGTGMERLRELMFNLRTPQSPAGGAPAPVAAPAGA